MSTKPGITRHRLYSAQHPLTFGVDPVRVSVGECRAVTELLNSLRGLVVDLEDATRPSPTGRVRFRHFVHTPPTRRIGPRVVGDGPLQEDWGRQLAGIVGNCGKLLSCPAGRSDVQFGQREQFVWDVEIERSVDGFAAVGRKGCGYRTGRPGRLRMKLRLAVGFRRWGTRANWLSGLRNDIDLRKMASEKKPRSVNCRHVPEASELNGENGCCLEVLKQTVLLGRTKVQLDRGLLAALPPKAQLSLCASGPVLCGSRVTEHKDPGVPSMDRRRDAS